MRKNKFSNMGYFLLMLMALISIGCLSGCNYRFFEGKELTHVLCLASSDTKIQGLDAIDQKALAAYREMGYELHFDYYQNVNPDDLSKYPVVVGMIPQLHPGTEAISGKLGDAIEKYVRDGGGFLLISEPSYYGVSDWMNALNPWLKKFDIQILNEQPRDSNPANNKEMLRILSYKFFKTANIAKHPATEGVELLWFPTYFSDSYIQTYTMQAGSEWNVLVRGEKTCASYQFNSLRGGNKVVGTHSSEPPLLAARRLGKGEMAVFSTSSGYFIWDAMHWANGSGFVLQECDGLKLMCNLFKFLSSGEKNLASAKIAGAEKLPPPPVKAVSQTVSGNVPIMPDKNEWLEYAMKKMAPDNSSVKYYIDCGAMSDIPYNPERGFGYLDVPGASWYIRWPWSEIFHATASNSRAFDIKPLQYRFDNLDPKKKYDLGVMVWGFQPEGARTLVISSQDGKSLKREIPAPLFSQKEGPKFELIEIPGDMMTNGSATLSFSRGEGGQGTFSSICELWLFENGNEGIRKAQEIVSNFESPSENLSELKSNMKQYRGLIGAKSEFSGEGKSTVAELSKAAQDAGLSFLVFTDMLENIDEGKLAKLKEECKKASNPKFTALPGFEFSSKYPDMKRDYQDPKSYGSISAYVFNNVEKLPDGKKTNPYELLRKFQGGELCGGKASQPNLLAPGKNGISPFFQRFWRGFDVLTFDEDLSVTDDSKKTFIDVLSSGYAPYPRVSGVLKTPDEIRYAAKGWNTVISAPNFGEMPLFHYTSHITNGPELAHFTMSFDHYRELEWGGGLLFTGNARLSLNIKAVSPSKMKEITLYEGNRIIRKWHPDSPVFEKTESVLVAGNHEFWMNIKTEDGKELISGRIQAIDSNFLLGMCSDNQNTICSLTDKPSKFEREERELYYQHSYWHTGEAAGQLGILKDARDLVPRIIEVGIIQAVKSFVPSPVLNFSSGSKERHGTAELRIKEGSGDFNITEYKFDVPEGKASSKVILTAFRPSREGGTAVLVETEITAKEDLSLAAGNSIGILSIGMMPTLPQIWNYTCTDISKKGLNVTGKFTDIPVGGTVEIPLDSQGGVMLWPSNAGNLLIFPLSGKCELRAVFDNLVKVWNCRERVSLNAKVPEIKKGETVKFKYLVVLHSGMIDSESQLKKLRELYTDFSAVVKKVNTGKVLDTSYPLRFSADKTAGISAVFDTTGKFDPVPLLLEGVNPNSSSGIVEEGNPLKILESAGTNLRTVVPPGKAGTQLFVGSLFQCSSPELIIEWGGIHSGGIRFHAHNPSNKAVNANIATNIISGLPKFKSELSFAPGESAWGWGKDDLTIYEGGFMQIDRFSVDSDNCVIKCHGKGPFRFSGPWKIIEVNGIKTDKDLKEIPAGGNSIDSVSLKRITESKLTN